MTKRGAKPKYQGPKTEWWSPAATKARQQRPVLAEKAQKTEWCSPAATRRKDWATSQAYTRVSKPSSLSKVGS